MRDARVTARDLLSASFLAVLLLGMNAAFVSAELGFLHKPKKVLETDHLRYIEMAKGSSGKGDLAREAPFCFRVLVPAAAGGLARLGLSLNASFYLLTNLSLYAFLLVLFVSELDLGLSRPAALVGMALVGLTQGAVRWYEYQYWMTDPACLALVATGVHLIRRDRFKGAAVAASLGVLVRETALLVLPYALFKLLRTRPLGEALREALRVSFVPLVLLVSLHVAVRPAEPVRLFDVLQDALAFRSRHLVDNQIYLLTVGSLGVLLPMVWLLPKEAASRAMRSPEDVALVLLAYASLLLANNTERLLAYAIPAVLPQALLSLRAFAREAGLPFGLAASAALAVQALFWWETEVFSSGASVYQPTHVLVVLTVVAFCLGAFALVLRRRSRAA